jgi:hypothetical protein
MTELVSVQCFKPNRCVDCVEHLKTFGAVRCKECNMRRVGKRKRKK